MQSGFKPLIPPRPPPIDPDKFRKMVAERAYCKFEKRGFVDGRDMEDWLEAESEIKNQYFYWFQEVE